MRQAFGPFAVLAVVAGCTATESRSPAIDASIIASVDSATRSFAAAERARDAEAALAHLAPDFYMYVDGVRASYDSVAAQIRRTLPSLASFETEWSDIEVRPLGPDHALVTFTFRDVIRDSAGVEARGRGPTTLVWARRDSGWRIIYADADHYADPPGGP